MAWNKPSEAGDVVFPSRQKRKGFRFPIVAAGAIVVVGAGFAAWWLLSDGGASRTLRPAPGKQGLIKEVKPVAVPKAEAPEATKPTAPFKTDPRYDAAEGLVDDPRFPYDDHRKVMSSRTNSWNQIIDICMMPNGRRRKVVRDAKPPVFECATDQLIAMTIGGDPDVDLPPLPIDGDLEVDFHKSLQKPIVINDDDDEKTRRMKEDVIEARKVIDEELRKGHSFKDILADHAAQRKQNMEMRAEAMATARDLKKSGDAEALGDYLKKVNGLFEKQGIAPVSLPGRPHRKTRTQN